MKCTMMKQILALLSWCLICIPKEPEAFTFAKMEVGHPVRLLKMPYFFAKMQIVILPDVALSKLELIL